MINGFVCSSDTVAAVRRRSRCSAALGISWCGATSAAVVVAAVIIIVATANTRATTWEGFCLVEQGLGQGHELRPVKEELGRHLAHAEHRFDGFLVQQQGDFAGLLG